VDFEVWLDDLQLFLLCDSKDGLLLFDLTSGASTAPAADADSTVRSQWLTRDAAARLAVRSHLPSTERADFSQYKSAKTLGDPPFLFCPLLPLLLLSTLLALSRSALRLLLARGAASARASGARALEEVAGEAVVAVEAEEGVGVGVVAEVGASVAVVEVEAAVAVAVGVEAAEAAVAEVDLVEAELCSGDPSTHHALVRPRHPSSFVSGTQGARGLGVLVPFPDATEIPRWGDLLKSGVAIFDLDFDAILAAMYAVSISAEGDCYGCVPPDPGIGAAALGASESVSPGASESAASGASESAPSVTASAQVLHAFTLDSGASRSFFRDRTTLTQLSRPVAVSLADPSGGPVVARYSTVLPCLAAPSSSLSGLYIPSFSTNLVSGADLQDAGVDQFTPASQRVTHCSCVGLGQRAAPHSSEFPPTEASLQTLHMDVWGPARIRGHGHERYFLLVVDDYSRYTTVFPLRRKDEVTEVLIDWIRVARLQLRERFGLDFLVLRLHSDRGREFSSDLLRAFCRTEGIRQTLTLPASPQQNGIAERRIGMVMDVARTSMIHAAAPHFLWPFVVQYAAHQINLQPRLSSETCLRTSCPPVLFLASSSAFPLTRLGPAPSGVSQVDAVEPIEVAVDSGTSGGAEPERAEPGGAGSGGAGSGGPEPERAEPGGAGSGDAEPGVAESGGAVPTGAGYGGPSSSLSRWELPSPQELRKWFARRWSRAARAGGAAGAGGYASAGGAGATSPGGARTRGTGAARPGGATGAGATGGAGAGGAAGVGATGGTGAGAAASASGSAGAGAAGGTGAGGAAGAGAPVGAGVGAPGAAGGTTGGCGAAGVGADAGGAGVVPAGSGGAARPWPYFVPLLEQVLGLPPSSGPAPSLECPPPVQFKS
ncbi:unnamed protein product, partial [Closterium sp. NIES-54]